MLTPITDEALTREAYARLPIWRDGCREAHDRARECRAVLRLRDPLQDAGRRRDKPTLQLQTLRSTFNNCVADQLDNLPEAILLPQTPNLQPVAEDLTALVRHILSQNDFDGYYRRRVEDCFCSGAAVTQILWDPDMDGGRGNVALIRWPLEAFLWDPAAEDIQEARALYKVSRHPMSWFQAHYPEKYPLISADDTALGLFPLGENGPRGGDEDRAVLLEYWYRRYDADSRQFTISAAYFAGGTLLARFDDVYDHGLYPFVVDVYSPIEGSPAGDSLISELAPMMRYINRYADYIDMNLRMASKGRLLVDRGAGLDQKALCDWESDIIEGDRIDPGAVKWLQTVPFSGAAMQQMLQLESDLKQDSGQNQFSRGETVGGVTAASAISALQEAGGKVARMRTAMLNRGFAAMVEQLLWLIAQYYEPGRVMCLTGREGARMVDVSPCRLFASPWEDNRAACVSSLHPSDSFREDSRGADVSSRQLSDSSRKGSYGADVSSRQLSNSSRKGSHGADVSPYHLSDLSREGSGPRERQPDEPASFKRGRPRIAPPGYVVQVQIQRRNPLRQQAQNELLLQAYQMAAQAGAYFPLTTLFELLQTDGKEKILPALRQAEEIPRLLAKAHAENEDLRGMCQRASQLMKEDSAGQDELMELVAKLLREKEQLTRENQTLQATEEDRRREENGDEPRKGEK